MGILTKTTINTRVPLHQAVSSLSSTLIQETVSGLTLLLWCMMNHITIIIQCFSINIKRSAMFRTSQTSRWHNWLLWNLTTHMKKKQSTIQLWRISRWTIELLLFFLLKLSSSSRPWTLWVMLSTTASTLILLIIQAENLPSPRLLTPSLIIISQCIISIQTLLSIPVFSRTKTSSAPCTQSLTSVPRYLWHLNW